MTALLSSDKPSQETWVRFDMIYLGIDFGGTKIEAAAFDENGVDLARQRLATPGSYDDALVAIARLVQQVQGDALKRTGLSASDIPGIGIGAPGSVSPRTGMVRNANTIWLNGRNFRQDLETTLKRPVKLSNDANCLALSEALDGAGAGYASVMGVIIGTGCGGGLVINNRLIEGANGLAGEIGHIGLPWATASETPGPACWCGLSGCLETWVSGTGFARQFFEQTGRKLKSEDIIAEARGGNAEAQIAFDRLLSQLGRALAGIVNLFDPDVFVFGGGLSNVSEIYERLPAHISPYVFSDGWGAKLAPAKWGDSSGVRGAAYLWRQGTPAILLQATSEPVTS